MDSGKTYYYDVFGDVQTGDNKQHPVYSTQGRFPIGLNGSHLVQSEDWILDESKVATSAILDTIPGVMPVEIDPSQWR